MGKYCFILIHPRSGFHNYSLFIIHFSFMRLSWPLLYVTKFAQAASRMLNVLIFLE